MMMRMMIVTVLLMMTQSGQGFLITKAEPGLVVVSPGDSVTLFCAVDDHYEWCKWFHPGGQFCDFEWKRNEKNITMQECDLHDRVAFHGKYDDKECGITFTAQQQDTGLWRCEIEEYVTWRSRGAGRIQTAVMNVTVQTPTPPPSPPPTSSATSVTSSTTSTHATIISTKAAAADTELSSTTPDSTTQPNKSKENLEEEGETPEAEPQVDEIQDTKAGSSSSALISVVVVLVVIVILISGAVYYRRRQSRSPASAVYEKEAKTSDDQADMVRNSNSNITFHSGNPENSNLHEYFPPNLTYSTVTPESQA